MQTPERSFEYERWANRHVHRHLGTIDDPPDHALELLAHVLAGLEVWIARIEGQDSSAIEIWPDCSLAELEPRIVAVESAMSRVLTRLSTGLDDQIQYTNQHGYAYTTRIRDVLFHLATHGSYHRGQISLALRQAGRPPINTDYITFVRELAGQPWKP